MSVVVARGLRAGPGAHPGLVHRGTAGIPEPWPSVGLVRTRGLREYRHGGTKVQLFVRRDVRSGADADQGTRLVADAVFLSGWHPADPARAATSRPYGKTEPITTRRRIPRAGKTDARFTAITATPARCRLGRHHPGGSASRSSTGGSRSRTRPPVRSEHLPRRWPWRMAALGSGAAATIQVPQPGSPMNLVAGGRSNRPHQAQVPWGTELDTRAWPKVTGEPTPERWPGAFLKSLPRRKGHVRGPLWTTS